MLSVPSAAATVAPDGKATPIAAEVETRVVRRRLWFFVALGALGTVGVGALHGSGNVATNVHSGSPGYRQAKSGENQLWHRRAVTLYVDASLEKLDPAAPDAVYRAFGHWLESHPGLPALTFDSGNTSVQPQRDGKSTVSYGPITAAGHERDLAITVTYSNEHTGEIVEADILLNSAHPVGVLRAVESAWRRDGSRSHERGSSSKSWLADEAEDCRDRYDVQNVLTHEAGHFFGLGEDMTELGSTMFQRIDECETHKRVLAATDAQAIGLLYAQREEDDANSAAAPGCSTALASAEKSSGLTIAFLVGALATSRRARQAARGRSRAHAP
jgi:hypothetical protein